MKNLFLGFLITLLSVPTISMAVSSKAESAVRTQSEPPPDEDTRGSNEETDSRQETYEGNDRGGGDASGGFNEGGQEYTSFSRVGSIVNQTTEDRGDVLIITRQVTTPVGGTKICVVSVVKVIEKATGTEIKSESNETCYLND